MTHTRSFDLPEPPMLRVDGDTNIVEGWIIPYGQVAEVTDIDHRGVHRYREGFRPGSCTRMAQQVERKGNAGFIRLTLDHSHGFAERVGCGVDLVERGTDGAYATFKLYAGLDLAKVRSMIEQSHKGFSIEFDDVVEPEVVDDVTWRRQVAIPAVTLTPTPAYTGAAVMALREAGLDAPGETPNLDAVDTLLAELRPRTVDT